MGAQGLGELSAQRLMPTMTCGVDAVEADIRR